MTSTRCAVCKYFRRRCPSNCIFAPYFPPDNPQRFTCVRRIYGASNIGKMLEVINLEHNLVHMSHLKVFRVSTMVKLSQWQFFLELERQEKKIKSVTTQTKVWFFLSRIFQVAKKSPNASIGMLLDGKKKFVLQHISYLLVNCLWFYVGIFAGQIFNL